MYVRLTVLLLFSRKRRRREREEKSRSTKRNEKGRKKQAKKGGKLRRHTANLNSLLRPIILVEELMSRVPQ